VAVRVLQVFHGGHVHAGVVPDGGVGAAAGLHAADAVGGEHALAQQELGVLAGVDVIGDDGEGMLVFEPLAEAQDAHRLAGADGAADTQAERAFFRK
jgi:hypothetical protein